MSRLRCCLEDVMAEMLGMQIGEDVDYHQSVKYRESVGQNDETIKRVYEINVY